MHIYVGRNSIGELNFHKQHINIEYKIHRMHEHGKFTNPTICSQATHKDHTNIRCAIKFNPTGSQIQPQDQNHCINTCSPQPQVQQRCINTCVPQRLCSPRCNPTTSFFLFVISSLNVPLGHKFENTQTKVSP
jgi:hypothetical protein